jgi:hypothetical protein
MYYSSTSDYEEDYGEYLKAMEIEEEMRKKTLLTKGDPVNVVIYLDNGGSEKILLTGILEEIDPPDESVGIFGTDFVIEDSLGEHYFRVEERFRASELTNGKFKPAEMFYAIIKAEQVVGRIEKVKG